MMVWDSWAGSGSTDERRARMKSSVIGGGLTIVAGMWKLSLCVLTIPMLSSLGHLHRSEELLFVCTHPVTPSQHSLRTRPGQGFSFNSGHLLLLSVAKLFVISHFLNLYSSLCSATVHNQDEGCKNSQCFV